MPIAGRIPLASREEVTRPPSGWRKPIPTAVKLQVIVNQRGVAPDGTPLDAINVGICFDHRPPIHERPYDAAADEVTPACNDPAFIIATPAPAHRTITGQDNSRMARTDRLRSGETEFQERLSRKVTGQKRQPKGSIKSRGFPSRSKVKKVPF
jgi:hypothetical protein